MHTLRKNELSFWTIFAAIFCLVFGFILCLGELFGLVFILIGLGLFTIYEGTTIDTKQSRFRVFTSVFLFKIGTWEVLPALDYILVRRVRETHTGEEEINVRVLYKVYLMAHNRKKNIFISQSESRKVSQQNGKLLSDLLKLEVVEDAY